MSQRETPQSIHQWTCETFGPPLALLPALVRTLAEMHELLDAILLDEGPVRIADEAADVVIILARVAGFVGLPLTWDTEWASTSILSSASAANLMLARMISTGLPVGDTAARSFAYDLHWIASHMARICNFVGLDLQTAIDGKMAINRTRKVGPLDANNNGKLIKCEPTPVQEMRERGPFRTGERGVSPRSSRYSTGFTS